MGSYRVEEAQHVSEPTGDAMKANDDNFSIVEAARILQCDEEYVEAMVKLGRLKSTTSPTGAALVSAESIVAFSNETWEGIREMAQTLLAILGEQYADSLDESLQAAISKRRDRCARRARRSSKRDSQLLTLVETRKRRG